MTTRNFPTGKEQISLLGFGCMRLPRLFEDRQDIDYELGQRMVDYAYEHGVNYFDTAYPYHEKLSEPFIGQALKKYPRESFYLATKMPGWLVKTQEDAENIFEEQLRNCQVDYFDFYLCHNLGEENFKIYEQVDIYGMLKRKQAEGKIRHLGFSHHGTPEHLAMVADRFQWDFCQIQLNYLDWEMQDAKRQYEILTERALPVVVMEPVRGGALAGLCEESLNILHTAAPERSAASWALRFAASLPNVLTVLSGMSTLEQVVDNVETMERFAPLTAEERTVLARALEAYCKSRTIPCTGCRYCMDCPAGVDIPMMFTIFNRHALENDGRRMVGDYTAAGSAQAQYCVGCRKCMEHCPQDIEIPARMRDIVELVEKLQKSQ